MTTQDEGTGGPPEHIMKQWKPIDLLETPSTKASISPLPNVTLEERLEAIEISLDRIETKLELIFGDFILNNNGQFINIKKL